MKKLLTIILTLTSIYSQAQTKYNVSLNGLDQTSAQNMIKYFCKTKGHDTSPTPNSYWFNKDELHSVVSLMKSEIANSDESKYGIRVYFASDPSVTTPPFNTSIILVSTFDSLNTPPNKSKHRDYYEHNFQSPPVYIGQINSGAKVRGARLYKKNKPCTSGDCGTSSTLHYLNCENSYKAVKEFGADTINTVSEWFDFRFIEALDGAIYNNTKLDGLRIYFAKGKRYDYPEERHFFVLTPTKKRFLSRKNHNDYYKCLPGIDMKELKGYYDNGELCPNNCD